MSRLFFGISDHSQPPCPPKPKKSHSVYIHVHLLNFLTSPSQETPFCQVHTFTNSSVQNLIFILSEPVTNDYPSLLTTDWNFFIRTFITGYQVLFRFKVQGYSHNFRVLKLFNFHLVKKHEIHREAFTKCNLYIYISRPVTELNLQVAKGFTETVNMYE